MSSTATFSTSPPGSEVLLGLWWSDGRPARPMGNAAGLGHHGLSLLAQWAVSEVGLSPAELCRTMSWSTGALDRLLLG